MSTAREVEVEEKGESDRLACLSLTILVDPISDVGKLCSIVLGSIQSHFPRGISQFLWVICQSFNLNGECYPFE